MDSLQRLSEFPYNAALVFVAVVGLLLLYFYFAPVASSSSSTKTVLLVGTPASGKTALFSRLSLGWSPPTATSMKENQAVLSVVPQDISSKDPALSLRSPVEIIDIPGHPRLRTRLVSQHLGAAKAVIFCVDSTGISTKGVRDTAECLHLLLALNSLISKPVTILVLLTKSDQSKTAIDRAKASLGRELDKRRSSSSVVGSRVEGLDAVSGTSSSSSSFSPFGRSRGTTSKTNTGLPTDEDEILTSGEAFPFEGDFGWDKLGCKIEWATSGSDDVKDVWKFICNV